MKKYLLFLFFFASINSYSQDSGWSEPVQISKDGRASYIDFTIDNNNVIHCVWREYYDRFFRKIFYSKSEDLGETWSEPEDISLNTENWADHPLICTDSRNNIYIVYTFPIGISTPAKILLTKYDGNTWSTPINVAEGYPNSEYPCITIDNNDRIYVFWHYGYFQDGHRQIYYCYVEDTVWSEVNKPFDDGEYYIRKIVADEYNNLHYVGQYKKTDEEYDGYRAVYIMYDYENSIWQSKKILSDNTSLEYIDIDLDSQNMPHIVWTQYINDSGFPENVSFFVYNNGIEWSPPETIGMPDARNISPSIAIDAKDKYHITLNKLYGENIRYNILKYFQDLTIGSVIEDTVKFLSSAKIKRTNNSLWLFYAKEVLNDSLFVFFRKKELITCLRNIKYDNRNFQLFQNYPNPFNNSTNIRYFLNNDSDVRIVIYDITASIVKTLVINQQTKGNHAITWDGLNDYGKNVSSGIYFYKIVAGKYTDTKKMLLIQ